MGVLILIPDLILNTIGFTVLGTNGFGVGD